MLNKTTMLVSLTIGMPPQTRIAGKASDKVEVEYNTARRQARVSKTLFSKQDIRPLQTAASRARTVFNEMSLPYDAGNRIIPTKTYFKFAEKMVEISGEFDKRKTAFLRDYHLTRMRAEMELGELYDEKNYPPVEDLEDRIYFSIDSSVVPATTAFDDLAGLDEAAIEKLKAEAVAGQQRKVGEALQNLFSRLFTSLSKASVKLADKDAVFRDTLLSNIETALDAIETLNLTDDQNLITLAEEVKATLEGLTPEALRKDEELRLKTAEETQALVNKVGEFFV